MIFYSKNRQAIVDPSRLSDGGTQEAVRMLVQESYHEIAPPNLVVDPAPPVQTVLITHPDSDGNLIPVAELSARCPAAWPRQEISMRVTEEGNFVFTAAPGCYLTGFTISQETP